MRDRDSWDTMAERIGWTFEVVDLDGGDVLGTYTTHREARADADALLAAHPDLEGDIVVMTFDCSHHQQQWAA
jgi:hypothetical protein